MISLLQRVTDASVTIDGACVGQITVGLLVFLAVEKNDSEAEAVRMAERIMGYRVFEDDEGKMNLNLKNTEGELLLVPQFTLAADTQKGMRPSFSAAALPEHASKLFDRVVDIMRPEVARIQTGQFGADMQVKLTNDGPVTFWLST